MYLNRAVKSLFFYPMLFLRGIFLSVGNLISGLSCTISIVLLIAHMAHDKETLGAFIGFFGASFFFFMLNQFYDQVLLKLNPTDNVIILGE